MSIEAPGLMYSSVFGLKNAEQMCWFSTRCLSPFPSIHSTKCPALVAQLFIETSNGYCSVRKPAAWKTALGMGVAGLLLLGVGSVAPAAFLAHFTVFVLACILGYMVIWNVKPALHTPLMSVTNAISGIIVIGALLQVSGDSGMVTFLAAIAVLIATINIAGGFLVTQRMLKMFQK